MAEPRASLQQMRSLAAGSLAAVRGAHLMYLQTDTSFVVKECDSDRMECTDVQSTAAASLT